MYEPTVNSTQPEPAWPQVIGVISIIYALLGMTCLTLSSVWAFLMPVMPRMFGGGTGMPAILIAWTAGALVVTLVLGVMLLTGGIAVIRRRPVGVRRIKLWAVLRIVFLLVGIGMAIVTAPAQIAYQKLIQDAVIEQFEDQAPPGSFPVLTDEQILKRHILAVGISSGVIAIYPLFVIFFLGRKSIDRQVAGWLEPYDAGLDDEPFGGDVR